MRNGQFTNEQIVALLQEAEKGERSIAVFRREKGITETTYYRWRHRFGGLGARDVQRLRDLEKENARFLQEKGLSQRQACRLVGLSQATGRYQPRVRGNVCELAERLRSLAAKHPRFPAACEPVVNTILAFHAFVTF